ncbi:MAG: aminoacyl-histidine dipeptidase [Deltaproteobacteria bacterium]|nr:aminoacyl-histidine dipeptidase [Deltaproteobacteria bacterium]
MASPLDDLEPRILWQQFDAIRQIPRASKNEEQIAAYVLDFAAKHGLEAVRDGVGNVIVRVPATKGHEQAPATVLQGHLDMVAEKNSDVAFDFDQDPIAVRVEGDLLLATGTTLGADNGMGVAGGLAVAIDEGAVHGPLELLFTVDEETGLTGAAGLDGKLLKGRRMLNLDTEEDGALYVGCAGGCTTNTTIPLVRGDLRPGTTPLRIKVLGLRGGHSGCDIHESRGNAIKLATRVVRHLWHAGLPLELVSLTGGSKHNAIPREADAVVRVAKGDIARAEAMVKDVEASFKGEFGGIDPELKVVVEAAGPAAEKARPMSLDTASRVHRALAACPHGVLGMSRDVPGLVETSNNLAVVTTEEDKVVVVTSSRSSVAEALHSTLDQVRAVFRLAGGEPKNADAYPGWKPDMASPVLATTKKVFTQLFGKEPAIKAIHAGLECGILGEKIPGIDMVSFGPQIENPHSPGELCRISTVARFYSLLKGVLKELA